MAAHGLSDKQLADCMAPNARWAHAASQDGWVLAHDALREDMKDLHAAVEALLAQAAAGKALTAWQARPRRAGAYALRAQTSAAPRQTRPWPGQVHSIRERA